MRLAACVRDYFQYNQAINMWSNQKLMLIKSKNNRAAVL